MKRKPAKNKWRTLPGCIVPLLCTGLSSGAVQAAPMAQTRTGSGFALMQGPCTLSNTNLLVVPSDRIVGVWTVRGTFTNTGEYGQTGIAEMV